MGWMNERPDIAAIIVAAGAGARAGGDMPKQYRQVRGKPMLRHSFEAFARHPAIGRICVVIGDGQEELTARCLEGLETPIFVRGGASRRESVRNALEAIATDAPEMMLIHDAARPFLDANVIDNLIMALETHKAAVPALPVVDSLARGSGIMDATVERDGLWRIQAPQAFHFDAILSAHRTWDADGEASDDARMAMAAGYDDVALVDGDERLGKFTFASDFSDKQEAMTKAPKYRSGTGFDVHRLVAGEELWLCGVKIEHHSGLSGHSDADVALHALTDAMLGALALGDIGDHFPPSDPQWRGASSGQFVTHAMKLAREKGYALANADITIICEEPKIGPHKQVMRERLAAILDTPLDHISVKATTTEKLGFTGRKEGIAAQASATFFSEEGN